MFDMDSKMKSGFDFCCTHIHILTSIISSHVNCIRLLYLYKSPYREVVRIS